MAVQGPFDIDSNKLFRAGVAAVGDVTPVVDFERSTKENRVQARDKVTGELLWQVDVMDFDPEARERTHKVKIVAPVQPVPPDAMPGAPIRPVYLEGLTVTPYIKETGNGRAKIAYSLRATGMSAPKNQPRDNKAA